MASASYYNQPQVPPNAYQGAPQYAPQQGYIPQGQPMAMPAQPVQEKSNAKKDRGCLAGLCAGLCICCACDACCDICEACCDCFC